MNSAVMFSKATDEWTTPLAFFRALDHEFQFALDAAATLDTSLTGFPFYGPDHPYPHEPAGGIGGRDALVRDWFADVGGEPIWLNPPYSKVRAFMAKAAEEARKGCTVVCLVPSRTDTQWWHAHVWDATTNRPRPGVEVRFIKGRLKFGNSAHGAPFPSVVIVFRPPPDGQATA